MRFLQLISVLAIAAPIIAFPLPASDDIEYEEDDEACGAPSGILRPDPLPVEKSSSADPPKVPSLTSEVASVTTSVPTSALTSASTSVPTSGSTTSSHGGRIPISDPLTFVPFPTVGTSDSVSTSVPASTPSDVTTSDPTSKSSTSDSTPSAHTSKSSASDPTQKSTSVESSTTSANKPTTVPNPPATPSGLLRGVNVGNWLVIEPWMDDGSLLKGKFQGASDQWTFDGLDKDGSAIKAHWDSWFTEADVQKIKSFGFNALRIPIGYWAIDNSGTPYHKGAADYMDKAIGWARNAGMKVMVDCHGSPGSQNGQMHSGRQGNVVWQQDDNLQKSTEILQKMVQKWGTPENADVVFAIEIVSKFES